MLEGKPSSWKGKQFRNIHTGEIHIIVLLDRTIVAFQRIGINYSRPMYWHYKKFAKHHEEIEIEGGGGRVEQITDEIPEDEIPEDEIPCGNRGCRGFDEKFEQNCCLEINNGPFVAVCDQYVPAKDAAARTEGVLVWRENL